MEKISGIYKITNKINKKCYIGQSRDIYARWRKEKQNKVNVYLKNAFKKYGLENFTFEILEECEIEKLNEREIFYIGFYRSNEHDFGYNFTSGGGQNTIYNDEVRKNMSLSRKGKPGHKHTKESKKKISKSRKGIVFSEEHRRKLSEIHKGKITHNAKKVLCVETGIIYESIFQACKQTGASNITKCCRNSKFTAKGYHWQYI